MGLLPKNQPKKTIDTPRNFFVWGKTMHGKSYLASQFPNPVIFNTDGNADQIETPSVDLKNERDPATGKIKMSVIDQLNQLIIELERGGHGFETVVIDVIDDVVTLIEQAICEEHGVQYIGDIPYGKGFGIFKSIFTAFVVKLKALPMNVIYISRYSTINENGIEKPVPSLSTKHLNVVNGNCDMNILCQKIGKNYIRRVVDRRKAYQREWIKDPRILEILDTCIGAFEKPTQTSKEEAKKIVETLEKQEEQAFFGQPAVQPESEEGTRVENSGKSVEEPTHAPEPDQAANPETPKQPVTKRPQPKAAAPRPPRVK